MKEQVNIFDTLLSGLKSTDYDSLIAQERLRQQGYSIHFAIDADLIGNYCYPEGIVKEETSEFRRQRLTKEYIADEQVTLHSIFNLNRGAERVIFFDQYLYEFQAMIYKATKVLAREETNLDLPQFDENIDSFRDWLFHNYSKIIASVLLKKNGLEKAASLFRKKLIIFEAEDLDSKFLETTTKICTGNRASYELIFKVWQSHNRGGIFRSQMRDCIIIDRVLSMNSHIQSNGKGQDRFHCVILLSDSNQAQKFFQAIKSPSSKIPTPTFDGEKIDQIRSVPQMFAYLISLVYESNGKINHGKTIKNIELLRNVSEKVDDKISNTQRLLASGSHFKNELLQTGDYRDIFNNYLHLRNAFENTGLLKSFHGIYESLQKEIETMHLDELKALLELIKKEMKSLMKELSEEHQNLLRRLEKEAIFTSAFINSLELVQDSRNTFDVSKGEDFVEGSFHHLPIFLIFPEESIQFRHHMNKLILLVLSRKIEESQQLCAELGSLLEVMKSSKPSLGEHVEINLLKAFIFMILPSDGIRTSVLANRGRQNDRTAMDWLKSLNIGKSAPSDLNSDHKYLLCWAARRIGNYDLALKYGKEGAKHFPNDPRFYHGIFLAEYCLFEQMEPSSRTLESIDTMIQDLDAAMKHYPLFIDVNFPDYGPGIMLSKIRDTYHNSRCYCLTIKAFELHNANGFLQETKKILTEARFHLDCIRLGGKFHDELPEYYDTEAYLEYLESFYVDNSLVKVEYALAAINKAIWLSSKEELKSKYNLKLAMIEERIIQLRTA